MTYGKVSDISTVVLNNRHSERVPGALVFIPADCSFLIFDPRESRALAAGKAITKHSGDSKGHFKVVAKLTRPNSKAARFAGL